MTGMLDKDRRSRDRRAGIDKRKAAVIAAIVLVSQVLDEVVAFLNNYCF